MRETLYLTCLRGMSALYLNLLLSPEADIRETHLADGFLFKAFLHVPKERHGIYVALLRDMKKSLAFDTLP